MLKRKIAFVLTIATVFSLLSGIFPPTFASKTEEIITEPTAVIETIETKSDQTESDKTIPSETTSAAEETNPSETAPSETTNPTEETVPETLPETTEVIISDEQNSIEDGILLVDESDLVDACYISGFAIKSIKDGTAPFDSDDAPGNDSSNSNNIVRSFDHVNYTLEYTTAIRDTEILGIDQGYVCIDFSLNCDPAVAVFDLDTMSWCLNLKQTYYYEDGTMSNTWDQNKLVVKQQLTGQRLLVNNEHGNAIPGTGTLTVGIYVKGASNDQVLTPTFILWMDGNPDEDKVMAEGSDVTISAAPKYDISVSRNHTLNALAYYDANTGIESAIRKNSDDIYGRLQGYGVALSLRNDSPEKGLKGIELPAGDITFDLRISEFVNGNDVSYSQNYTPFFWDYKMNETSSTKGVLGRNMRPLGQSAVHYTSWQTGFPYNKAGDRTYCCYDGGRMAIEQNADDSNLFHVTLKGYKFDTQKFIFPDRDAFDYTPTISSNIGYFSVGYIQILCQFPEQVTEISNVNMRVEVSNISAATISGQSVTNETSTNNNLSSTNLTVYPTGSHSKRNFFKRTSGGNLASPWSAGNAYAAIGSQVCIQGHMVYTGDAYLTDTNILQKFDDKYLEIPAGTTSYSRKNFYNPLSQWGTVNTLFAAKPDKSGWASDDEMNDTREEQLIYFDTIDDLNSAGYICVGILWEVRDSMLYPENSGGCVYLDQLVNIKSNVMPGTVAMTKNDVRSWQTTDRVFSWLDKPYDSSIKAYGLGDPDWNSGYVDGYQKPKYVTYLNYEKAIYENGTMIGGHWNSYQGGNSLLIIGNKAGVNIKTADTSNGNPKYTYDLDAGERNANFKITPLLFLDSSSSEATASNLKDDVKVTATLPKGLHYNPAGVSVEPNSIVENPDGTVTITWEFNDVVVSDGIEPIYFSAIIGEEGTINDVKNNESFVVSTKITSKNDPRNCSFANGNYSETSILVIKLAASAVIKRAITPLTDIGEPITYRLRYSNISEVSADDVRIYDILPYNEDRRVTSFSGRYQLKDIDLDFTHASETLENNPDFIKAYITKDTSARTKAVSEKALSGNLTGAAFSNLTLTKNGTKFSAQNLYLSDITALLFEFGNVQEKEYVDIYITITPADENNVLLKDSSGNVQQPGDTYSNDFSQYANNQVAIVNSNVTQAKVVHRLISGTAWLDQNQDGKRQSSEPKQTNLTVTLYSATKNGPAVTIPGISETLYRAYDVFGKLIPTVNTDASGNYQFNNLAPGDYYIVFTGTEGYGMTYYRHIEDQSVDSDTKAILRSPIDTYNDLKNALQAARTEIISFPDANHMLEFEHHIEHVDAGFIVLPQPGQSVSKISDRTEGTKFDPDTGRFTGDRSNGFYMSGDTIKFTITITNTGDSDLLDLMVNEDISNLSKYLDNFHFECKANDVLKTTKKNDITVKSIVSNNNIHTIQFDILHPKDSVAIACSGTAKQIQELAQNISNKVSISSSFTGRPTLDENPDMIKTPDTIQNGENFSEDHDEIDISGLGSLAIHKISSANNQPLSGVAFELKGENGFISKRITDEDGNILFDDLTPQTYTLTEIATVYGYTLLPQPIQIQIPLTLSETELKNHGLKPEDGFWSEANQCYYFYNLSKTIENSPAFTLTDTGRNDFYVISVTFAILIASAFTLCYLKRKCQ